MKTLFVVVTFLMSFAASADEAPSWWALPEKGKNCSMKAQFKPSVDCGKSGFETWTCIEPATDDFTPARSAEYLIVGTFKSDVGNACSPTFVVRQVIRQNE